MQAANQQIPNPTRGIFLIDTGASTTAVDESLITPLAINPIGATQIHTPSTNGNPQHCFQYDVMLFIPPAGPGEMGHIVESLPVTAINLSNQGIHGLIGRDVLEKCVLVYNGTLNLYTLSF